MRRRVPTFLLLLACAATALAAAETPAAKVTLALVGGRIVDGYEGRPIEDGVILIAGERIAALGPRVAIRVPRA
jgi:imidazolonepropionase-like amidohydrolase